MENTGVFDKKNCTFSSIFIIDKDSTSMMFQREERTVVQHLESIADQIVDFSCDSISLTKDFMPVVDMKPDPTMIDYWQTPYIRNTKVQL